MQTRQGSKTNQAAELMRTNQATELMRTRETRKAVQLEPNQQKAEEGMRKEMQGRRNLGEQSKSEQQLTTLGAVSLVIEQVL